MQFYVLGRPPPNDWTYYTDALPLPPHNTGKGPLCPQCHELAGLLPWLPPYHAEVIAHDHKFADVAFVPGLNLLLSDRFRRAWFDAQLVGIDVFNPIERIRVRPARLKKKAPIYFHVAPRLFDVQVDLEHSLIEYTRPITCAKCKSGDVDTARGFSLDDATWRGEDIFLVWGMYGPIIVSDRVRELRDKHSLTNVNLTPTEEYLWDPEKRWTPWCYYLPDGIVHREPHEYEYVTEEDPPAS